MTTLTRKSVLMAACLAVVAPAMADDKPVGITPDMSRSDCGRAHDLAIGSSGNIETAMRR